MTDLDLLSLRGGGLNLGVGRIRERLEQLIVAAVVNTMRTGPATHEAVHDAVEKGIEQQTW
ncbi:MAG: hypothetical protein R2873_35980 [Caldilineaceae bacterium]